MAFKRQTAGPQMRLLEIGRSLTKLVRDERVELPYYRAYEVRNYTERVCLSLKIIQFNAI